MKDRIVKAFSAWDSNKSIWENLKNIGGIIKDSVIEWWKDSPFNKFYEQYLDPFVQSAKDLFNRLSNLGGFIKNAILDWWNGDSTLSETLTNIGGRVWDTIKEWWEGSIFKEYWEKAKVLLSDMVKPIKDWYNKSFLKKTIDKIGNVTNKYVVAPMQKISAKTKKLMNDCSKTEWSFFGKKFHPFSWLGGGDSSLEIEEKVNEATNPAVEPDLEPPDVEQ